MKVENSARIEETEVTMEGAAGARMRLLISERDGARNFAMRMFTVAPGGHTPYHNHNYEHEVYILEGQGVLKGEQKTHEFGTGDVIFVQADEKHQFLNTGAQSLKFLCLIPAIEKCA